jgi:hypothetical protein
MNSESLEKNNINSNMRKVAITGLAGTSIERYEFFLYGAAAALIFQTAFVGGGSSYEGIDTFITHKGRRDKSKEEGRKKSGKFRGKNRKKKKH